MKPADYLSYYATKFNTVEVDSTFYRTPSAATVNGWERKTPAGFLLAAKIPQLITHENVLQDCEEDLKRFLETMDLMGDKLGPLLFQFGYFNKSAFPSCKDFLARLAPFLKKLPKGYRFALEIRNKQWLTAEFFDLLREHRVAYALIDQAWMPRPSEIFEKFDPITADFTYIRLLGDRKGIEQQDEDLGQSDRGPIQGINELGECLSARSPARRQHVCLCEQSLRGICACHGRAVSEVVEVERIGPRPRMSEFKMELCGKCGAEIDRSRRVDYTLKDGTRVCESCFVKETRRPKSDWPN